MNKILKIGMLVVAAVVIAVGGAAYYVSTQINSEEIKKLIVQSVSNALPETSVTLEKVEYDLGLSVMIYLQNFDLRLKDGKTQLFQVGKVELKVPIWAILTGGGTINVQIQDPTAYYLGLGPEQTNWQRALPKQTSKGAGKSGEKSKGQTEEFKVPGIVENSKVDIKISDLKVDYRPHQKPVSNFKVSKILFKNINLKSSTAYEIKSSISYAFDEGRTLKTNLQMIGEVNIGKFVKNEGVTTAAVVNIKDTSITGMGWSIPNFENKLKVELQPDGVIQTQSEIILGNLLEGSINASYAQNVVSASKFRLNLVLSKLESIMPSDFKQSLRNISFANSELQINGDWTFNLQQMKFNPNLSIEMNKPVSMKLGDNVNISSTLKGTLKAKQVTFKIVSELMDGSITSTINTDIDPLNLPQELSKYPLTKVSVVATNIKLSRNYLQNSLYGNRSKSAASKEEQGGQPSEEVPQEKVEFPPLDIGIEGKNIFIAQEEMEFTSELKVRQNKISSDKFQIHYSKGKTDINFSTLFQDSATIKNDFDIKLTNMNLSGLNSLLPPYISQISGTYEGSIQGRLNLLPQNMQYDIKTKLTATNGDLKDLDLKALVASFFENLKDKVPKEYEKISNKFDKLAVEAHITNALIELKKFLMIGDNKSMELALEGKVSMQDEYSKLTGTVILPNASEQLKREFGIEKLPVQFDGQGFILKPNLTYTTGKLADLKIKMATSQAKKDLQKKADEEKEKLKKQAEKEKEKVRKQLEEKGKNLLKGIKL